MKEGIRFKPNPDRLLTHLHKITGERNAETTPQRLHETELYIKGELTAYGFQLEKFVFPFSGRNFSNWIARWNTLPEAPRLILGAHFDSVPGSPGADDNATGMAALLETARIYADAQKSPSFAPFVSVEFAAFNLEEYGMIGSRAYARRLKQEKAKVIGMLSLEMIGYTSREKGSQKMPLYLKPFYPDVGNFIGLVANTKSRPLLQRIKKSFGEVEGLLTESLVFPGNGRIFPEARLSDHSPFWDEGFKALLITDTSFFRNPHYHTPTDRVETLDLDFLAKVTEAITRTTLSF